MYCSCGGRMKRSDIEAIPDSSAPGGFMYQDTDPIYSNWACICGKTAKRKKRQARTAKVRIPAPSKSQKHLLRQKSKLEQVMVCVEHHRALGNITPEAYLDLVRSSE